jgi:hypothetical protein
MAIVDDLDKKLRETSPDAHLAVSVFMGEYINKAKEYESAGREILETGTKVGQGKAGEVFSDGVHKGADWGGKAAGAATGAVILAAGAALGGLIGGPVGAVVGAWVVSGLAGLVGGAVAGFVSGLIESAGRALAGALGIDFHTHGTTPGGGTWNRTDHPDGSWDRHEKGPSFDVDESGGADGSFSQTITGKGAHAGYKSHFRDNGKGVSHFEAVDRFGVLHLGNTDDSGSAWGTANSHDTDKSNGKSGQHVVTEGSKGGKSDIWFYNDGSSKETQTSPPHRNDNGTTTTKTTTTEKDADGHTTKQTGTSTTTDDKGNTTTVTTTTDDKGKTETKTESHDSKGHSNNPPEPPPGDDSSRDNPEGQGSEGPPFQPGEMGKGRPGHPFDEIRAPGSWKKDNGEWQGEQPPRYRDLLAGIVLLIDPMNFNPPGDTADDKERTEDLLRKLRGLEIESKASGEDFIHPKARAKLIDSMMRSAI